jgi:hypothetical protein
MNSRSLSGLVLALAVVLAAVGPASGQLLQVGAPAPDITGSSWINSDPLSLAMLRGRVVLVEFWTYG